jgi:hypothetical protein
MKFSIGDRVLLKRTGEEGTILSFINKQLVEVEVSGVAFPAYADELDHPYLTWFSTKPVGSRKKAEEVPVEKAPPPRPPQGLHLSFLPVYKEEGKEEIVDLFKIHLLNETPYSLRYTYEARDIKSELLSLKGEMQPFSNLYLHSLDFETMSAVPRFLWEAQPVEGKKLGPKRTGEVRLRPPKLFQHLQKSLQHGEPTFRVVLLEDFVEKEQVPLLEHPFVISPIPQPELRPSSIEAELPAILDLHLSALLGDGETLPRGEALPLQIRVLRHALEETIVVGGKRLMVIHGLGRGILRNMVHEVLRKTPEVAHFSDDWHPKYGFGATEVWFT